MLLEAYQKVNSVPFTSLTHASRLAMLGLRGYNAIMRNAIDLQYGRELLKGNTDSLLLYLIGQEPTYGYRIIKELDKRSGGYFCFREGTLYPALHRLEKAGLVRGAWEKLANGQERRYYRITDQGREVLEQKLAEWRGFSTAVNLVIGAQA